MLNLISTAATAFLLLVLPTANAACTPSGTNMTAVPANEELAGHDYTISSTFLDAHQMANFTDMRTTATLAWTDFVSICSAECVANTTCASMFASYGEAVAGVQPDRFMCQMFDDTVASTDFVRAEPFMFDIRGAWNRACVNSTELEIGVYIHVS